jgi:hypothetical protein
MTRPPPPGSAIGPRQAMLALRLLVLLAPAFLLPQAASASLPHPEAPRLLNYYLNDGFIGQEEFIARWDVVIVVYKHLDRHPESLALLRQFNPDIRILVYVNPMAISTWIDGAPGDLRYDFQAGVDSLWIAYTATGDTISYWANTIHPNVTERCPVVGGERYRDYFTRFTRDRLSPYIADGTIDGIFIDEMSHGGYLWWDPLFDGCFDYDSDQACDAPDSLQVWLTNAVTYFAESTAAAVPTGALVMANNCKPFQGSMNGKLFEAFPASWEGGLAGSLNSIDFWSANSEQPSITAVNGIPADPANLREFRYRYAGSLLTDCYFNYDYSTGDHYQDDWFELFDFQLGLPRGPRFTVGEDSEFTADFEAGLDSRVVEVPYASTCEITDDPELVLEGKRSLLCDVYSADPWPAIAEIVPPDGFAGGEQYTFSFLYRVLDCLPEGGTLFMKAGYSGACQPVSSASIPIVRDGQGIFRASLTLQGCDDYRIFLRAHGDITVVIDSLTLVKGRAGLLARRYEHGVVLCNDSGLAQVLPYDAAWELVDGDGQHQQFPLWLAGQGISIPNRDGVIFHYAATAAESAPPDPLILLGSFPNPLTASVRLDFVLPSAGSTSLEIIDVTGRRVQSLVAGWRPAGTHSEHWDGRDAAGRPVAAGVYFARLAIAGVARAVKLQLLR